MKTKTLLSIFAIASVLLIVSCNSTPNPDKVVLNDKKDSISYVIGLDYGTGLQRQFVDYNPEAMYKGLVHAQNGEDLFSDSIKLLLITDINQGIEQRRQNDFNTELEKTKQASVEFIELVKVQEGVIQLPSGLLYKIIVNGIGNTKPAASDSVVVHYRANLTDGTLVDETYGRLPTRFRLTSVMLGLAEGIQLMNPGAIYEFIIPPELGFGDQNFVDETGNVLIPAGSALVYRIELINIEK